MIFRVVTHEVGRGQQYADILQRWTIDDLDDWNCVIDAIEDAQRQDMAAREKRAQQPKRR